jgi:hypothetical protein
MIVEILVLASAGAAYLAYRNRTKLAATIKTDEAKITAFAKTAEIEGKLIALRAVAAVKAEEAKIVHALLDDVNKVL